MRISARRALTLQPDYLAVMPTGQVITLSSEGLRAKFLHAYGPDLEPVWNVELPNDAIGLMVHGHHAWVLDRFGISAYDAQGVCAHRVPIPVPQGMRLGAFAMFDDDFTVAIEHDNAPPRSGALMRVSHSGEYRWTTSLPMDDGGVQMYPSPRDSWHCSYFVAGRLTISGDALLVVFGDITRTGIGMAYVVALDSGTLRHSTRRGPIQKVAGLGNGEFLVGYQGYGAFETLHYGRHGEILNSWRTHGYYVVYAGEIRVIELRNDSETMELVRLGPRGQFFRGAGTGWLLHVSSVRPK